MAFNKAIPEAFCFTLFNGSRDNDGSKEPRVFYRQSTHCTITCKTTLGCFYVSREQLQNLACCAALCKSAFCNHLNARSCRENTNSFCLHRKGT